MNYCEINISGQKVGLKFGLPAYEAISKQINLLSGDTITVNLLAMVQICWHGYLNNCMRKDVQPELKFENFYDEIEKQSFTGTISEEVTNAINVFAKSKEVKNGEEVQKKNEIDWEDVEGFCLALGADYKNLSWREYVLMIRGYNVRRAHDSENTRALFWATLKTSFTDVPDMEKLWPLITDEKKDLITEEQALLAIMESYKNGTYGK